MEYRAKQPPETAKDLSIHKTDLTHPADTEDLLQQSLALADHLESLMDSSVNFSLNADSVSISDDLASLDPFQDPTVFQSAAAMKSSQSLSSLAKDLSKQTDPDLSWTQVWLQRGVSKLQQGNFQGAQDNFKRVLQKTPHCVEALNGLGVAQYGLTDLPGAVSSFRQGIQVGVSQPILYCNLGAVLYKMGDFLNAIAAFQKAARLSPKEVIAYYGLGVSLIQHQEYGKAMAAFQRAIALDAKDAKSYYGLAYVHYRLGELPAAIAALGKAKQRNPGYAQQYEIFLQHCLATEHPIIRR
jgi:tetratricopeptide (TPR) repeat protein